MSNKIFLTLAVFAVTLLSGCEVIGDIFQVGMAVGVIIVVVIIAVLVWIFRFFTRRS